MPTIHTIIDLEAYYDRQLQNLYRIIEESVGIDRNMIKLIMKVILIIEHYVCTGYRMSKEKYGGIDDPIIGIGQGNITSGNTCRDKSCYIIKYIEKKKIGAIITVPILKIKVQ